MADLEYEDYYFIRIGEDYDDIEVNGGFWDNPLGMRIKELRWSMLASCYSGGYCCEEWRRDLM